MRMMHVIGSGRMGGAERFFIRLTGALAREGQEVITVTRPGSELNDHLDAGVEQLHVPMRGPWDLLSRLKLRKLMERHRPSIVQTYMGRATSVTRIHRSDVLHVARLGGYYRVDTYRHADCWVGNTRGICDYLIDQGLPSRSVFQIGNFVDRKSAVTQAHRTELRQRYGLCEDDRVIVAMGRLHRNKAFDVLLEAFSRLSIDTDGRRTVLLLLGDGPLRSTLGQQAVSLGVSDRVHMPGWQHDIAAHLQLADVFVCSSRHEPLGNVILEAWSEAVPVISTRAAGPSELIEDAETGHLVPVDDPDALAQAIAKLLAANPSEREALCSRARMVLDRKFSEAAIVGAYLDLYRRLRRIG
ncbi:MAG: glycosyltransferase [Gammaproteobacteria bacterium]|nr:glycosyltransferase [Gammaproteobacteria bacterium]